MLDLRKFYIGGHWVDPSAKETLEVVNPSNEKQIGIISLGNKIDVETAVSIAKNAFISFSTTSRDERLLLLKKLRDNIERRLEDLAQAMTAEMGAPISMSRDSQAASAVGHADSFIHALQQINEREVLNGGDILLREPIGVCGLITPWNWPILQIVLKVIPALAAGCACILKPSEYAPISASIFSEIIDESGFPNGVFNMINGRGAVVGTALAKHPDVEMISFTGSTRAGREVTINSSETVKRVMLELGGKSPNIVFEDCDLEERVKASVDDCFYNSGQSCDAPTRMLVEKSCYDRVVNIVKKYASQQRVDDASLKGHHIGPLFNKIQFERVQELIQTGIDEGAKILVGGLGKPEGKENGWFVKPTVFTHVDNSMHIAQLEIFGPVLVLISFDTEEEAIMIANDSPYGLAAYIQTGDELKAQRVASKLKAGQIHINGSNPAYPTPFGGYKQSGNGREGGLYGLEEFYELKTICRN